MQALQQNYKILSKYNQEIISMLWNSRGRILKDTCSFVVVVQKVF